jgi:tetrahydromethanopterin S-methyltransferase subunit E
LEHALFGIAAAVLGFALLLRVKASAHPEDRDSRGPSRITAAIAGILQSIGIGSLMPLPGFLLLVLGNVVANLLLYGRHSTAEVPRSEGEGFHRARGPLQAFRWRDMLAAHIGLCFAFVSMAIFSVVLIDRVADVLFAMTALVSVAANYRLFLRG